ncbi:hypothetical protein [Sphingomonas cavernae]|uniref:hypothetical protein n=1 Tax=Sphingomonas cavernae TaxID=2320861 RepID=UPI0011C3C178|nr:hypothetical protein [Sphingomonas cavernae]
MEDSLNFWDMALRSAKRAVNLEGVDNISFACLKHIGTKNFEIEYGFHDEPTDEDLESLSLIETEMVSDIWNWVGNFRYTWSIRSHPPQEFEGKNTMVFYRSSKCP